MLCYEGIHLPAIHQIWTSPHNLMLLYGDFILDINIEWNKSLYCDIVAQSYYCSRDGLSGGDTLALRKPQNTNMDICFLHTNSQSSQLSTWL